MTSMKNKRDLKQFLIGKGENLDAKDIFSLNPRDYPVKMPPDFVLDNCGARKDGKLMSVMFHVDRLYADIKSSNRFGNTPQCLTSAWFHLLAISSSSGTSSSGSVLR